MRDIETDAPPQIQEEDAARYAEHVRKSTSSNVATNEPSVEDCLKELREMFPNVEWITCRTLARDYGDKRSIGRISEIDLDDRNFRAETLSEAMSQVRAYNAENP